MSSITEERVDVADGKYTVVLRSDGSAQALRYGEYWPGHGDSLHDNLTLALARDLIEARAEVPQGRPLITEDDKSKAGAELMQYSWMMSKCDDFNGADCDRVREIAAWLSVGAPSDLETASASVIGAIVRGLKQRGYPFAEDRPFAAQFLDLLDRLPAVLSEGAFRMGARAMREKLLGRAEDEKAPLLTRMILEDTGLPTFPEQPPRKLADWAWWSGASDDIYTNGPCSTREAAIDELDGEGGHIIEAVKHGLTLNAARLLNDQYFDADDLFDHDHVSPERKGGADVIAAADDELQALLDAWLVRWGHTFVEPNMFAASRNVESVAAERCATCESTDRDGDCGELEGEARL